MTFMAYFGHLNIDVTIKVDNIASRGSAAATGISRQYGGTLGNFAFIASSLGLDFHPYSAVCSRSHSDFLGILRSKHVDLERVEVEEVGEGPTCYIITDGNDQNAYMFQGPMDRWRPDRSFTGDSYEYIHFSTGPPEPFLDIAGKSRSATVFDPSQELFYKYDAELIRKFVSRSDIVMGNRQEIESILRVVGLTPDDTPADFDFIMTDGENGALSVIGGERTIVKGRRAERAYDTIGAGDAFRAGFYSARYRGLPVIESIAIGNITASIAVSKPIFQFTDSWETVYGIFRAEKERFFD